MEKIRDRLQGKGEKADPDVGPGVGNKHASKDTRRVEIGWLNFEKGKYYQVRTRHGGGTRHMSVQKTMTMEELLDIGKALFFPNGKSAKGPLKDFKFDVRDFSHCPVPLENTVQQLYDQTKLRMLRIYTCSKEKDKEVSPKDATIMLSDSDTSSDFEPTDHRPIKHSTLNDDAASPRGSEKEVHYVKFRRVNIVQDVLNVFMDPKVMEVQLIMELINEKALDGEGVSREVYSAFWELFLQQCEGEDERVPRLRPDYSEKEWQAVGVSSVDEELLMMSFLRYLSVTERESVEKVLEGNLEEIDEEDLLDLFSRMGSHCLPSKDKIRAAIVVMAHKALLQEPKFIIDCFHSSIHNAVPRLLTKESIMELYEQEANKQESCPDDKAVK
ncbi:UDP-N-acetylmuramoyl-L-alanyl-D-glutamate--26-diaminopimelate ligase [Dissostichus eleginoides]|uniref:UDP-N-acetylmuramoyl-L-alanyl-D-glutamate--26-diaminopimelate ligase n=1 Tax=Dissostichus eleginoides TaxID=100907 RepID=A0AAD9FGA9_DISEL|nr:UDP-N-acetylmuramoyl-L-alanyl-D-glutamate--26-diaminopimelate ligase [Dissostichus eleginoides]